MSEKFVKPVIDWTLIEVDYRSGIKTVRQIAEERDVSHVAIGKRAKKHGWTRDLAAQIKAKAEAKVTRAAVTTEVTAQKLVTEQQVVEANAEMQYRIRMEIRGDITRLESLCRMLMTELESQCSEPGLFAQLGELLDDSGEDANGKYRKDMRNDLYNKVISMTGRVDNAKKLVEMFERLVKMKREAFGIEGGEKEITGVEAMLKRLGTPE